MPVKQLISFLACKTIVLRDVHYTLIRITDFENALNYFFDQSFQNHVAFANLPEQTGACSLHSLSASHLITVLYCKKCRTLGDTYTQQRRCM